MATRPTITTQRLRLRPLTPDDAPSVQRYVGDREIAMNTLRIPHPYPEGAAAEWIGKQQQEFDEGRVVGFAIEQLVDGELAGAIGLELCPEHRRAEMGYWIGKPYWGKGYATEAAQAVLAYGFDELGLNRICAHSFERNPASRRVLEKIGMTREGAARQHIVKWGEALDIGFYAMLRSEYSTKQ